MRKSIAVFDGIVLGVVFCTESSVVDEVGKDRQAGNEI